MPYGILGKPLGSRITMLARSLAVEQSTVLHQFLAISAVDDVFRGAALSMEIRGNIQIRKDISVSAGRFLKRASSPAVRSGLNPQTREPFQYRTFLLLPESSSRLENRCPSLAPGDIFSTFIATDGTAKPICARPCPQTSRAARCRRAGGSGISHAGRFPTPRH